MKNIKKVSWKKIFLGSILVLVATGCASLGNYPEAGTPVHKTFVTQCSQCHALPHPGRHTPEQWDHVLGMMVKFMDEQKVSYTKENMRTIRGYLHRNAR
jgi:hypothetical protein